MSRFSLSQQISFVNPKFQFTANDHLQNIVGTLFQFFAGGDVVLQARTSDEERTVFGQLEKIEGWDRTTRAAEENHVATRAQNVEALFKRGLSHTVIDHVNAFAFV